MYLSWVLCVSICEKGEYQFCKHNNVRVYVYVLA